MGLKFNNIKYINIDFYFFCQITLFFPKNEQHKLYIIIFYKSVYYYYFWYCIHRIIFFFLFFVALYLCFNCAFKWIYYGIGLIILNCFAHVSLFVAFLILISLLSVRVKHLLACFNMMFVLYGYGNINHFNVISIV